MQKFSVFSNEIEENKENKENSEKLGEKIVKQKKV